MSMSEQAPRQHGRKITFRTLAAVSTAAILLGSSFYAAQAGTAGFYEDDLDGSETLKTTAIVAGTAVGVMLLAAAIDRERRDGDTKREDKAKTAKAEQVRVVPSRTGLTAGDATVLQVQARYPGSKTWSNVTDNAGIRLVSGNLTQVDGSKNAFAVPYGSKVISGPATVEASFGGRTATAEIQVN